MRNLQPPDNLIKSKQLGYHTTADLSVKLLSDSSFAYDLLSVRLSLKTMTITNPALGFWRHTPKTSCTVHLRTAALSMPI